MESFFIPFHRGLSCQIYLFHLSGIKPFCSLFNRDEQNDLKKKSKSVHVCVRLPALPAQLNVEPVYPGLNSCKLGAFQVKLMIVTTQPIYR
jgi:hypothetical protein